MTARYCPLLALVAGLGMAPQSPAQEPPRLRLEAAPTLNTAAVPADQTLADAIAHHLRQSGQLHQYAVNVTVRGGAADLTGFVADQPQREEAVRLVQGVPGVERVRDRLVIGPPGAVAQVQAVGPAPSAAQAAPAPGAQLPEPTPVFQAPTPSAYDLNPPRMPPYAWPTYAPYNNYSRVAMPTEYPYNAWPFIGPCHPFPEVPLGWRSVKLTWEDGYWWYSKHSTSHDWWRLRYW